MIKKEEKEDPNVLQKQTLRAGWPFPAPNVSNVLVNIYGFIESEVLEMAQNAIGSSNRSSCYCQTAAYWIFTSAFSSVIS